MAYYLIEFFEDQENWKLSGKQQLEEGLHEIFPTVEGCGQVRSIKQLTDNNVELTMLQEEDVVKLFENIK